MTILPPPERPSEHECRAPGTGGVVRTETYRDGTLWECPSCGRWWKLHAGRVLDPWWAPVSFWDVPARRRIANHETAKMHYRCPTVLGDLHWWDCHPNPKRGRP